MEYDATMVWISRAVKYGQRHVKKPVVASLLVIGWLPVALSILAIDVEEASQIFLVVQSLAVLPVTFGPFIVWYYNTRVFPSFFETIDELVAPDQESLIQEIAEKYDKIFSQHWWITTLPFVLIIVSVFFVGNSYFASQGITTNYEQIFYLLFFIYFK